MRFVRALWITSGMPTLSLRNGVRRRYRRVAALLLRRDRILAGSERKFRALLEAAPDAIVIVDSHARITIVNAQAERMFGWDRGEIIGRHLAELIPQRFRGVHHEHLKHYLRSPAARGMGSHLELYGRRKDGTEFPVEISLGPLETDQGVLVSAAVRNITARKQAEAALREAEERFRTAFAEAPVGMALASLDGRLLQVNRAMCEIVGYDQRQLEATTLESITHPDDANGDRAELARLERGEATRYRAERRLIHAAGSTIPVDLSVAVVHDGAGRPRHFLAQMHDITERKQFEGQLQYLADHDALTGMLNRRRFEQELDRELARARRYGTGGAVLAIDLDHFKYVNDTHGHSVGDELITRVGVVFKRRLRATDVIARIGGDEFSVILPGADQDEAIAVAGSLLEALRQEGATASGAGKPRWVTASIGIAPFGSAATTGEDVLVEADIAMYDAKEAGRDRSKVYDSSQERQAKMQARLRWADRIRAALAEDRFVLNAQPIRALGDDQVPRYELLIRMLGDDDDLIPPGTFLYVGERFDLIQEIDRWVLRRAIGILASQKLSGHKVHLSVNLSAKSLADSELPAFVERALDEAGIDGHGLCVEITETAAIVNLERAREISQLLAELGCEVALDDFGAGFASFYYLKHMAFDYVKIDGEFIRHVVDNHVNQLVVRSVVEIARGLGKRTIAEFVGDAESVEMLKRYGVDYVQGDYIARPQSLEALELIERPVASAS
jgi:diguanylate cyclase (GGDEF)-like protein/PAS domain S-box-containing protein